MRAILKTSFFVVSGIFLVASAVSAATYKEFFVCGYRDSGQYRSIDIAMYDVKLSTQSEPITVQFELHAHRSYRNKMYCLTSAPMGPNRVI